MLTIKAFLSDLMAEVCIWEIELISHASKVMLKILQASFNSMWTVNFQMFKLNLEKAGQVAFRKSRGTRN